MSEVLVIGFWGCLSPRKDPGVTFHPVDEGYDLAKMRRNQNPESRVGLIDFCQSHGVNEAELKGILDDPLIWDPGAGDPDGDTFAAFRLLNDPGRLQRLADAIGVPIVTFSYDRGFDQAPRFRTRVDPTTDK